MLCSRSSALVVVGFCVTGLFLVGCDTAVPLFENPDDHPLYYSLYGQISYPDGGVIRVEPLRDSILAGTTAEAPETVTFTRLATGEVDTLEVSSRQVDELSVHNYRTPSGLTAGAAYRIRVEGSQGNASSARFTLPGRAPNVEVLDSLRYCRTDGRICPTTLRSFDFRRARPLQVRVDSVDRLARVALQYNTRFGTSLPFRWTKAFRPIEDDSYRIRVEPNEDLIDVSALNGISSRGDCRFTPPPPAIATSAMVVAVAAGEAWPGSSFNIANLRQSAAPRVHSNVEQGVGLVVGTRADTATAPVVVPTPSTLPDCS